jgi:hypothetical protein
MMQPVEFSADHGHGVEVGDRRKLQQFPVSPLHGNRRILGHMSPQRSETDPEIDVTAVY